MSLRSAAEVEQSPNRASSLKTLDREFGLTSAKPLFDRAPHPSQRGAASADNSAGPPAAALAADTATKPSAAALAADTATKPSAAALTADTATKPSAAALTAATLAADAPFESAL